MCVQIFKVNLKLQVFIAWTNSPLIYVSTNALENIFWLTKFIEL